MNLKLANINKVIESQKLKQVKTTRIFSRSTQVDGLFSEEIFGKFGSPERRKTFGYIDLKTTVVHPEVYENIFMTLDPKISSFLLNKQKYEVNNGRLIESDKGVSGVYNFIKIFDKLDLTLIKGKKKEVDFINKYKNRIFINKYLVLPAGIRDIQIDKTTNKSQIQYTQLNDLYENLIRNSNTIPSDKSSPELLQVLTQGIQRNVLEINKWIKERLKGKSGLIRGGLMKKTTDYSGRMVITTDNTLELGQVSVPWQVCLRLFEPFAINRLLKDKNYLRLIQDFLKSDTQLDVFQLKIFLKKLNTKPSIVSPLLKDYLVDIAKDITKDKIVLYKRDPVENRNSYVAGNIKVNEELDQFTMGLNPLELKRNGADHDGDAMAIFPLFTKEATEEAKKKMHPKYSKTVWQDTVSSNQIGYHIELDAAVSIYNATLE